MDESNGDVAPRRKGLLSRTMDEIRREQAADSRSLLKSPGEARDSAEDFAGNLAKGLAQAGKFNGDTRGTSRGV